MVVLLFIVIGKHADLVCKPHDCRYQIRYTSEEFGEDHMKPGGLIIGHGDFHHFLAQSELQRFLLELSDKYFENEWGKPATSDDDEEVMGGLEEST